MRGALVAGDTSFAAAPATGARATKIALWTKGSVSSDAAPEPSGATMRTGH
jgi:hypothetical protein